MPYPRAIGSGLGATRGHKIISKPYPFGSDIHGYPCPWVKLPSLPMNAIQVQINENIRMLAKLKERWAREREEEDRIKSLPTHHTVATIKVVEDTQTLSTQRTPGPIGPINADAMTIETTKQVSLKGITTTLLDSSDLDFDNCTLTEVIAFLHKMSRDPHTSTLNLAF